MPLPVPPPPCAGDTLCEAAVKVLRTADPWKKAEYGDLAAHLWATGAIRHAYADRATRGDGSLSSGSEEARSAGSQGDADVGAAGSEEEQWLSVPDRPARDDTVSTAHPLWCSPPRVAPSRVYPPLVPSWPICCFFNPKPKTCYCPQFSNPASRRVRSVPWRQVRVVAARDMPRRGKGGSQQSRVALLHSLVHIESWAVDLAWVRARPLAVGGGSGVKEGGRKGEGVRYPASCPRAINPYVHPLPFHPFPSSALFPALPPSRPTSFTPHAPPTHPAHALSPRAPPTRPCVRVQDIIARFGSAHSMPRAFFSDFVRVAEDEARHFRLLAARLQAVGSRYGALPAHDGLWESAAATAGDLKARLAIEHCVHEVGGMNGEARGGRGGQGGAVGGKWGQGVAGGGAVWPWIGGGEVRVRGKMEWGWGPPLASSTTHTGCASVNPRTLLPPSPTRNVLPCPPPTLPPAHPLAAHHAWQARGLDVVPQTIERFRAGGDSETAQLLEQVVYPEEVTHCAAGQRWFSFLCLRDLRTRQGEAGGGEGREEAAGGGVGAGGGLQAEALGGEAATGTGAVDGGGNGNGEGCGEKGKVRAEREDAAGSEGVGGAAEQGMEGEEASAEEHAAIVAEFHGIVRQHFRGKLKPPFNHEARAKAGLTRDCDDEAGPAVPTRTAAPLKRKPFKPLHLLNPAGPALPRQPPLHPAPGSTANPRARFNAPAPAAAVTCNAKRAPGAAAAEAAADETRYYSVMYCPRKPHAKRKGPWSDGLLSVKGRACAVQNMDAKSVAKASVSGCAHLKEGSTLEVGKWEVEVMHEVPREQYLAGSFFIPAAAAAAAAAAVTSAAATGRAGSAAAGKGRKRAGESSSGRAAGSSAEGVLANKRAASMESRMRLGNEDAVCLNPNQHGKGISKIYLDPYIGARMRPHQVEGVHFMLEAVLEVRTPGCSGCVLADEMGELADEMGELADEMGELADEMGELADEMGELADEMGELADEMGELADEMGELADEMGELADEMGELADEMDEMGELADEMGELADEMGELADEMGELADEMGELADEMGELADDMSELADEMGELADEMGELADEMGELADEMGELEDEMGELADEMGELADEMGELADEMGELADEMGELADEMGELADEMGLGKTLQVIALIWTLLKQARVLLSPHCIGRPFLRKAVVVCPSSLVDNWGAEFRKWLGTERLKAMVVNSSFTPTEVCGAHVRARAPMMRTREPCVFLERGVVSKGNGAATERGGGDCGSRDGRVRGKMADFKHAGVWPVLITSYDLLRRHAPLLAAAAPQLLVCDEGHRLKNCAGNKTISALHQLGCPRKVLLTGTPMQNDLSEFFALLDLVNPGCLGPLPAFRRIFADPIQKSRDRSATVEEVRVGEARSQELQAKAAAFVLRRTAAVNAAYLPPKSEYIVFCRLHAQQARQYSDFLRSTVRAVPRPFHSPLLATLNSSVFQFVWRMATPHPLAPFFYRHPLQHMYSPFMSLLSQVTASLPPSTPPALPPPCAWQHVRSLLYAVAPGTTASALTAICHLRKLCLHPALATPPTPASPRPRSPSPAASASAAGGEEGGDEEEWAGDEEQEEVAEEEQENAEWGAEGGEVGGCEGGMAGGVAANEAAQKRNMFRRPSMLPQASPSAQGAPLSRTAAVAAFAAALKALGADAWRLSGKLHVLALLLQAILKGGAGAGGGEGSVQSSITDGSSDGTRAHHTAAAAAGAGSGDKVVIVSNFTRALDVIEHAMQWVHCELAHTVMCSSLCARHALEQHPQPQPWLHAMLSKQCHAMQGEHHAVTRTTHPAAIYTHPSTPPLHARRPQPPPPHQAMCESHGWKTTRLDGSTEASARQALVCAFNTGRDGSSCFLLSSKAGGAGLNLVGANRLVLFDPDWNPANDHQVRSTAPRCALKEGEKKGGEGGREGGVPATPSCGRDVVLAGGVRQWAMARVWRDGQSKPVVIYRMLATGSIEEKIFQRQLMKGEVTSAVGHGSAPPGNSTGARGGGGSGSNKGGAGHFTKEELRELFTLEQATACDTLDLLLRSNSPLSAKWLSAAATSSAAPAASTISGSSSVSSFAAGADTGGGRGGLAAGIADGPLREVVGMCEGVTFVYHDSTASPASTQTPVQGALARGDGTGLAGPEGAQHNRQAAGGSKEEEECEEEEHAVLRGAGGAGVERRRSTERRAEEQGSDGRGSGAAVELLTFDALDGVSDDVMELFGSDVF
ncbi:unnamed protein product [Closterium sp. Naga37s-1]|nr:unnamed protein product [Closterium sp. Naga37s-1]